MILTYFDTGSFILALNLSCFLFPVKSFFAAIVVVGIFIMGESIAPEMIISNKAFSIYVKMKVYIFLFLYLRIFSLNKNRAKLTFIFPDKSMIN